MNNPVESPKRPKNFEPLTPEEIQRLDVIVYEDRTALDKMIDAAQSGDPMATYYMTHTKQHIPAMISHQVSTEVKTQPRKP